MSLKNEDFRKLLATPRPAARPNLDAQAAAADKKQKKPRPPRLQRLRPREDGAGGDEEMDEEEAARYRDRAAERRKGADQEGLPAAVPGVLDGIHGDLSHLTYEESKFLGGDVEHTHLVKGLDFALLNKIKSEQAAAQREGDGEEEGAARGAAVQRELTIKSPAGRAVHDFFFGPQRRVSRAPVAEQFLPRRTSFVFDLEDPFAPDVPTTLRRAKEDCPAPKERIFAGLDGAVLERMAKIMAYMTLSNGGRKKLKKKERQELLQQHGLAVQGAVKQLDQLAAAAEAEAALGPSRAVDEDDDIFGDAGTEYVVERRTTDAEPAAAQPTAAKRAYFEDSGVALDEGLPPLPTAAAPELGPARPESTAALAYPAADAYPDTDAAYPDTNAAYPDTDAAFAAAEAEAELQAAKEREREEKRKRLLEADADDGYAECYPAYHDMAGTAYDSEDDDGKRAAVETKDAPRSAAAEGAEGGPGDARAAAKREAIKVRMKETTKLSSELTKIKEIFSEKGYTGYERAFDKANRERDGKSGGNRTTPDEGGLALPAKKRRI